LANGDVPSFDEFLMKGMLGSKDGTTQLEAYNVLKAVDRLDKKFDGLRGLYDTLCEFTHPNWSGAMGSYSAIDTAKYVLHLGKQHAKPPTPVGISALAISLTVFQVYYDALADVLKAINDKYGPKGAPEA